MDAEEKAVEGVKAVANLVVAEKAEEERVVAEKKDEAVIPNREDDQKIANQIKKPRSRYVNRGFL